MDKIIDYVKMLPEMLSGKKLMEELQRFPEYDDSIIDMPASIRLMAMNDLYRIYVPSQMSIEIYSKMYLALLRSFQKKGTKMAILQQQENCKAVRDMEYEGIMGGSDSFTIIGQSGIGKSLTVSRSISLLQGDKVIITEQPYMKLIPVICVQCPFDSSVKGMLLEILRKVDEALGSRYYENAMRGRMTTDMLIGSVSQVALNHIGLLVVDEIQNVVSSKNGRNLVGALTQLINNSGISICMVGTPESAVFFESAMHLARRSLGLQYGAMEYDDNFRELCDVLLSFRYTKRETSVTESIYHWLYEHSGGIISAVVSLIHDSQEIAILDGTEELNMKALIAAYENRLSLLHDYVRNPSPQKSSKKTSHAKSSVTANLSEDASGIPIVKGLISETAMQAKSTCVDVISLLKSEFTVEEVSI